MAEKRDYYEVLGVDRNATADDIKSAYRKMALKWHPDRWVNGTDAEKKTAEENFKEASEAYSVLSDPDKKARYDRFGQAGLGGDGAPDFSGGFGNLNDILNELFGKGSQTITVDPPVDGPFHNWFDSTETYSGDKFDIVLKEGEWKLLVDF